MNTKKQIKKYTGFTLIGVLLLLVIISSILLLLSGYQTQKTEQLRIDRLSLQMQQILNAGMAYYTKYGYWPVPGTSSTITDFPACTTTDNLSILQSATFLPAVINNPWGLTNLYGDQFTVGCDPTTGKFFVAAQVSTPAEASVIAGRLPESFIINTKAIPPSPGTCTPPYASNCTNIVSEVDIPGQNLGNARSANYTNVYSSGACVPAPFCPAGMQPQIVVIPASVTGANDDSGTVGQTINGYAITSYTAFAIGQSPPGSTVNQPVDLAVSGSIPTCDNNSTADPLCYSANYFFPPITTGKYWRVCLAINTEKGKIIIPPVVSSDNLLWGANTGSVIAITRCAPSPCGSPPCPSGSEPQGADFSVWQN